MEETSDDGSSPEKRLGFKPQRELIYNNFLPYSNRLDEESQEQLVTIKLNLCKAVLLRDISPGALHWGTHLARYIGNYGRKFSKEDHILFIKLFYELVIIPDLELHLLHKFSHILISLLKKRKLISRDDLVLPWQPLYNLYHHLFYTSYEVLGMILLPNGTDKLLKNLIRKCRIFFPVNSTQEMLDEWRPLMCPYDVTMVKAMTFFELFLQTNLSPKEHHQGFRLWFQDFMNIWEGTHNRPSWESKLIKLFTRLATENIGYIDWDPYIPMIFTRILRSFNLPVGCIKQIRSGLGTFQNSVTEQWIVAMMGKNRTCQKHLNDLFKALESYYHPSNTGRWIINLYHLLSKLPEMINKRIYRERHCQDSYLNPIPDSHKLSEDDIDEFVLSIKPCVMLAMFSKVGSADSAAFALRNLSILRPKLVIPELLERLYPALEALTEPHRLMATMNCIVSVGPVLVEGGVKFPEGPTHVVPLLMLTLPGIDPNDIKKSMVTFQFISTFSTLIQLVDCSSALSCRDDLTEIEKEVCLTTVHFEDFVLQFMDRCFLMIQNSVLEHTTRLDNETEQMNSEEGMLEVGLASTFTSILAQSSPSIFKSALNKLKNFITGKVLETKVSGKYAANMVRSTVKVKPEVALKVFLPSVCKTLMSLLSNEEVMKEETLDDEIMFNLLLFAEMLLCDGHQALVYKKQIQEVLSVSLKLSSRDGYKLASIALKNALNRCITLYPLNYNNASPHAGKPMTEWLPIRDWGKPADIHNIKLQWHIPNTEEIEWATELINLILVPILEELNSFSKGHSTLSREELLRNLIVTKNCLIGAAAMLRVWKEEPIKLLDSAVPMFVRPPIDSVRDEEILISGQKNVREEILNTMCNLVSYILENCEDDTKSLFHIVTIFQSILTSWGTTEAVYEKRWKGFHIVKKALSNKLAGKKRHIRPLLIDRILLQHETRNMGQNLFPFSSNCDKLMKTLLKLATSHYSEIRIKSQIVLSKSFSLFPYSQLAFVAPLSELLKLDPTTSHEQFKGALYVLLNRKERSFLVNRHWHVLHTLWPAVINLKHSEKPSIISLLNQIIECINKKLVTLSINFEVPSSCFNAAWNFWKPGAHTENNLPSSVDIQLAEQALAKRNQSNFQFYQGLAIEIATLMENNNLNWRHFSMAAQMLQLLIRHDIPIPSKAVNIFFNLLVHETINIRKIAMEACGCILKQQKPSYSFQKINPMHIVPTNYDLSPSQLSSVSSCQPEQNLFGHRQDNLWLLYNKNAHPDTPQKFRDSIFVHKTHWGFYTWPKKFEVYSQDQEYYSSSRNNMSEEISIIHNKFSQKEYVDKLISFLSLEEKKGKDKFDSKRFTLFKGLFRNYQDEFLPLLMDHVKALCMSPLESKQRCAAEIIAGLIRGSKYWNFEKMEKLRESVVPVIRSAMLNITNETVADWVTCLSMSLESRDPNKYYWLIELIIEDPLKGDEGSFLSSSRLCIMLGGLGQQEWRVPQVLHRILNYLISHLADSYQNVREKIASILTNIFLYDTLMKNCTKTLCPLRSDFIDRIMPLLNVLNENGLKPIDVESVTNNHVTPTPNDLEKKKGKNLLKTVCRWLTSMISRSPYTAPPDIFQFINLLCHYENDITDDELKMACCVTLAMIGQAFLLPDSIEAALQTVSKIIESKSWHARNAILTYLQVMVFYNFFTVRMEPRWVATITNLVCEKLTDEQVEVRENAAVTFSGILHCKFIEISEELLEKFKKMCSGRWKKMSSEQLIKRHAGVLGLCACVNAHPYDVPQYIPDVLMILGDHLHDPQPILSTVKKTLSNFKRTHYDSWRDHKLKFSDDQLVVLTDLLVSPSYYA